MPHFIIEYSANVEPQLALPELMVKLRDAAVATDLFELPGIRLRAARRDAYLIADGAADNAFVHVTVKIGAGRSEAQRKLAAQALFEVLEAHLQALFTERGFGLSLEIVELDPVTSVKKNNLHGRLRNR